MCTDNSLQSTISQEQIQNLMTENLLAIDYGLYFNNLFDARRKQALDIIVRMPIDAFSNEELSKTKSWNNLEKNYEDKQISASKLEEKLKKIKSSDYEALLRKAKDQNKRLEKLKHIAENLHEDIEHFYIKKYVQEGLDRTFNLKNINKKKIDLVSKVIANRAKIDSNGDIVLFYAIQKSLINNENVNKDSLLKEYLNASLNALWEVQTFKGESTLIRDVVNPKKLIRVDKFNRETLKTYFAMSAVVAEKLCLLNSMSYKNHIFANSMESLEAYHPGSDLDLSQLEKALDSSNYRLDEDRGEIRTAIDFKKGDNKRERAKVGVSIKVKDDQVILKYRAIGVFGKKIDIVVKYENGEIKDLPHIEYSNQERLKVGPDIEFKTYDCGNINLFIEGSKHDVLSENDVIKNDVKKDNMINPFFTGHFSDRKLNLVAMGGEGLACADNFIRQHYGTILNAAKNYNSN